MSWQADFFSRTFDFRFEARTSRGAMTQKKSWFLRLWDDREPGRVGVGECSLLAGLSPENPDTLESQLAALLPALRAMPAEVGVLPFAELMKFAAANLPTGNSPALLFAFETALLDWQQGGKRQLFPNSFVRGKPIPINGLIWMADEAAMLREIDQKIEAGFTTLKLKVGSLRFGQECNLLRYIREAYSSHQITLRLDANGAFRKEDVLTKLEALGRFGIHSIEQPLPAGSPDWHDLCRQSPVPIALDEELIGLVGQSEMNRILERIQPHFMILKPSLHGGLGGCHAWISAAHERGIGYWTTSALESNVGLNAIAQFAAAYTPDLPQGLGTGSLFHNNFESPLVVDSGHLRYDLSLSWSPLAPATNAADGAGRKTLDVR